MSSFDQEKYTALLDHLEAVEISLNEVLSHNEVLRIDPEYFYKSDLQMLRKLESLGSKRIGDFAYVTDGIHASIEFSEDSGINLISAKCPKENVFDLESSFFIRESQHHANPRTALKEGDVVLSTVGTVGNCAVVDKSILPANSDRHVGIIRINKDVLPRFLSTFLLSRFGRFQTRRETTGNVQPNLFIVKIRELLVPMLSDDFQRTIDTIVLTAHTHLADSKSFYQGAEQTLLRACGLENWQQPDVLTEPRKASEVFATGRWDAEFFDPSAIQLIQRIKAHGCHELKKFAEVTNGYPWESDYFLESGETGEPFVRIRDCKPGVIENDQIDKLIAKYAESQNQPKANPGDLVLGMDGLKWFYAGLIQEPCYVNQRVAWVQLHNNSPVSSEFVLIAINSKIGQVQLLRQMTIAQTVGHITNEDVRNLLIPSVAEPVHDEVTTQIQTAHAARKNARTLLECAKRAVEIAIEQSEAAAITFLNEGRESSDA